MPSNYQTQIRNHGGGYVNHIFYWATLCPSYYSDVNPEGELREDIEEFFGNMTIFFSEFFPAATQLFGSGYAWLVEDKEGRLSVETTVNQVCAWFFLGLAMSLNCCAVCNVCEACKYI